MDTYEDKIREFTKNLPIDVSDVLVDKDDPGYLAIAHKTNTEKINGFFGHSCFTSLFYDMDLKKLIFSITPTNNDTPESTLLVDMPVNEYIIKALRTIAKSMRYLEIYFVSPDMKTIRGLGVFQTEISKVVIERELEKMNM